MVKYARHFHETETLEASGLNQSQLYFLVGAIVLPSLLVALHITRVRITLGPLFGVANIYSLMLLQLLQTGWWVSFSLQFNTALTLFVPALILAFSSHFPSTDYVLREPTC